jgi:hypothetical protein
MVFHHRDLIVQVGGSVETYCSTATLTGITCAEPSCVNPSFAATEAAENHLALLRRELRQALTGWN